jgi:hypothetical protein
MDQNYCCHELQIVVFYVLLIQHLDNLCNENQLDALFILDLFLHLTSTCLGHNHCPSSGGIQCVSTAVRTCVIN